MRLLLLAPSDAPSTPATAAWQHQRWDQVIDLGRAPVTAYQRWSGIFGCPVTALATFSHGLEDLRTLRQYLNQLRGQMPTTLVDSCGLDWLEILAVPAYDSWLNLLLLERMAHYFLGDSALPDSGLSRIKAADIEVALSSPCALSAPLALLFGNRLHTVSATPDSLLRRLFRTARSAHQLTAAQFADVICDKYDPHYALRRQITGWQERWRAGSRRRQPDSAHRQVVLVPTAYTNVSRSAAAYAAILPQQEFLFVSTRPSGRRFPSAPNITLTDFAAYAPTLRTAAKDIRSLESQLQALASQLIADPEWSFASRAGWFNTWHNQLVTGILSREGWRQVLDQEPVAALLCGDDSNPYTRIPLILAAQSNLPTIAYHHGALDGTSTLKREYAHTHLAKGAMELDYLTRVCQVSANPIRVGAAISASSLLLSATSTTSGQASISGSTSAAASAIIYFSEPYEVNGTRTEEIYRDLIPPLLELAQQHSKRLILKLHPFESRRNRMRLLKRLKIDTTALDVISGPLTPVLLASAWFGITVESSTAVDCSLAGVPCFLCEWAFTFDWQYPQQFARFGAGILLASPSEISDIPRQLAQAKPNVFLAEELAKRIEPKEFMQLLGLDIT